MYPSTKRNEMEKQETINTEAKEALSFLYSLSFSAGGVEGVFRNVTEDLNRKRV